MDDYTISQLPARKENENDFQYHKRILEGKLVDKTIDLDYQTLAPVLYGREYAPDVARRMAYGSMKTIELLESCAEKDLSGSSLIEELDRKKWELEKERKRFFDQRREYTKLVTDSARADNLEEVLINAANNLHETVGVMFGGERAMYDKLFYQEDHLHGTNEAVLVFSDWHYGMTTNNIFNKYNTDICKNRVRNAVENAIYRIQLNHCRRLHVITLGDLFHGGIHTSARVASEELVTDQIMQVSEILAQAIERLSDCVDEVVVYCTYGNHARVIQNKGDSIHRDNLERIVPWWVSERLKNSKYINDAGKNVIVAEPSETEFLCLNVLGHDICASHGDLDTVKTSTRLLPSLFRKQYGADVEFVILGDKHHIESFDEIGVTAEICGSLCGTDDFANDKRLYSSPSQLLLIVNDDIGVDGEYKIRC